MTFAPVATPSILNADIPFEVVSDFEPTGDQPEAIKALTEGIESGERFQTLLGITGSARYLTKVR